MDQLNSFSTINTEQIVKAAETYGTPLYLYDEAMIAAKCQEVLAMPNAYGLNVRYAMKANSNKRVLQIVNGQGVHIDASSLNEARRAHMAGIPLDHIMLTTQEVPLGEDRSDLEQMILGGMKYNVCSLRQLQLIGDFAGEHRIDLSIRIHPGVGAGESASRNTGDEYSCFGVHLSDVEAALAFAAEKQIKFTQVHEHIGSGGDPELWRQNIDLELGYVEKYFPDAISVSFGGGLKEARMPGEIKADAQALGAYAKQQIKAFYEKTGRKLKMEVEPGTYIVANCGYIITSVVDKKQTGENGFSFIILDGGMEVNSRPELYGSRHPFYMVSRTGQLLSSEFCLDELEAGYAGIIVGSCCESGDSQCLDAEGHIVERKMAEPEVGDIAVIGGAGAYCSSMAPFNYNSHLQVPEVLLTAAKELQLIRRRQTLEQIMENEL